MTYLAVENVSLSLALYQVGGVAQARFTLSLADIGSAAPAKWGIGRVFSDLTGSIALANPSIIMATSNDPDYQEGFNYESEIDLKNSGDKVLTFISDFFGIDSAEFYAGFTPPPDAEGTMGLGLDLDVALIKSKRFKCDLTRAEVEFGIDKDGEISVSVLSDLTITMKEFNDIWTTLVFTGQISVEPESITTAFTMNGSGRGDESSEDLIWRNPFGIPGVEIHQAATQIGMTYLAPFLDNIGVAGTMVISDVQGSLAILVDSNDYDNFLLAGSLSEITLLQLITAMSPVTLIAYQALPSATRRTLNKVFDVSMEDVEIYIAPEDTSIGAIDYAQGVAFGGKLSLWGWDAMVAAKLDPDSGIYAEGYLDSVNLINAFYLRGVGEQENPTLDLELSTEDQRLLISAEAGLLGAYTSVLIQAGDSGLIFQYETSSRAVTMSFACEFSGNYFYASGDFDFTIPDLKVELRVDGVDFGTIKLDGVSVKADSTLTVQSANPNFELIMNASFRYGGTQYTVPRLRVTANLSHAGKIITKVANQIKDKATDIFTDLIEDLDKYLDAIEDGIVDATEEVGDAIKDGFNASVDTAIDAFERLDRDLTELATAGYAAADVAKGLKRAGASAEAAADILKRGYGAAAQTAANYLKDAQYATNDIAKSMQNTYNQTANQVASILKNAGKGTQEIANALKSLGKNADQISSALKSVGKSTQEIANSLKNLGFSSKDVGRILKNLGIGRNDIAKTLKSAGFSSDNIADALKNLGWGSKDVAKALKAANYGKKTVKKALKSAGFSTKSINKAIDAIGDFFGL